MKAREGWQLGVSPRAPAGGQAHLWLLPCVSQQDGLNRSFAPGSLASSSAFSAGYGESKRLLLKPGAGLWWCVALSTGSSAFVWPFCRVKVLLFPVRAVIT